jgi:hypothetical protein
VNVIRRLIAQRSFAALLCAVTLMIKLVVPTGYMVGSEQGLVTIQVCSGVMSEPMAMVMPGMHGDMPDHGKKDHGKAEIPCAFAGLSAASFGAIDPIQLVTLFLFILAVGTAPAASLAVARRSHLRPPLRGPPASL